MIIRWAENSCIKPRNSAQGSQEVKGYGLRHPAADHRSSVISERGVWRLGTTRIPHRAWKTWGFRERFFRAGHAHAGVLLVLSLVYFLYLERTGYSDGVRWLAGLLLLAGILAQSGGFFIHLGLGRANQSSLGTVVTRSGVLLIGVALIMLVVGLLMGR